MPRSQNQKAHIESFNYCLKSGGATHASLQIRNNGLHDHLDTTFIFILMAYHHGVCSKILAFVCFCAEQ